MTTVHVLYLVNGTVVEETLTAERITWQRLPGGGMQVRLHDGGTVAQYVDYRTVERAHRIDRDLPPAPTELGASA